RVHSLSSGMPLQSSRLSPAGGWTGTQLRESLMKRIGLTIIAAALVACQSEQPVHPGFKADISDATHGPTSNASFFWLPPLTHQSAPSSQVFSQQLSPSVVITDEGPATSPP